MIKRSGSFTVDGRDYQYDVDDQEYDSLIASQHDSRSRSEKTTNNGHATQPSTNSNNLLLNMSPTHHNNAAINVN